MYLKQVSINGFKSFADKTEMNLTPGITCIVGPNGCGKSNIVDAVRWVLGEQSAKALRGGKMQDVIFQGTETRKPLQLCEVSLLFSDCEAQLGTNFNEVEITRKVSKDGGSDYYINGKVSRLKDIQNLFMDTGIGRVSYSFMVQGQIDQILSSNPGERRSIFEEAAGITKYKTQRREALNKLALVEQNLARATDRIEEIGRQIGSLKRQASKALRYKRLSHRLRHLDLSLNAKHFAEQNLTLKEDETELNKLDNELLELSQTLSKEEEALSQIRAERMQLMGDLERKRIATAEVRSQKEQSERNAEFAILRKKDLADRGEQIAKELESLTEQLAALEGKAKGDAEVKQMQLALVQDSDEIFKQHSGVLQEIEAQLQDAESALSRAKQDALVSEGSITRLRSKCTTLELDLKSYQVRHGALSDSIFQLNEELQALQGKLDELSSALENANERLADAEADTAEAVKKSDELRTQYRNQQMEIQQMDRLLASKSARLSLLNDFQSRLEGFSEGVKAILGGKLSECISPDSVKIVSQNVDVAEGWTSAFESLLGSALDAVVLEDSSKLSTAINALQQKVLGKACFQINASNFDSDAEVNSLPQGIFKGSDIVKTERPDLAEFASNLVSGCYFCEDISVFAEFVSNNKNFRFVAAVDKNGSMMDSRGIVFVSDSQKRDTESSFILRNKEIKRLKEEIEKDNDSLTTLNERAMQIQSELDAAEIEIENRKNASAEIKREIASINAQSQAVNSSSAEKRADLEKKTASMQEMENSRFEAQDRLDTATKELADAEQLVADSRKIIIEKEEQIVQLRESKDREYAVLSEARLDLAEKRSRLESLERGLGAIMEQQAETRSLIDRRTIEKSSLSEQSAKLDEENKSELERSKVLASEMEIALEEIEAGKVQLSQIEERVETSERALSSAREAHIRQSNIKNNFDVRVAKTRAKLDYISERILQEYEVQIVDVDWKREMWSADEQFEVKIKLDELEEGEPEIKAKHERGDPTEEDFAAMDSLDFNVIAEEVKDLRDRINAMGAVNLVAIEEYAELKERYDFLKTQTDDLWTSKNALVASIDEINETSQKLFADTFEQIRKNFAFTFQKVFGGGSADLKLVVAEDVLDSGIEIIARPPGTKLQGLTLLSGGQRTMTAVALLFAIYMVKPSPFCVLDELDAPLDDANIGRYTDLLKEFTRYSQFLVISHNKRTVSAAQTIYGVTMQERGVTRLISMRFNNQNTENITDDFDSSNPV